MNENWGQNDPNYKENLKKAMEIQDQTIKLRDLHKAKKEQNKKFQQTNDLRLTIKDFEEEAQLKELIKQFQE